MQIRETKTSKTRSCPLRRLRGQAPRLNQTSLSRQPAPASQIVCRLGDASCARAHASALRRAAAPRPESIDR